MKRNQIIGLFFLVGFLVYGSSLGNDFVDYDDTRLIIENDLIRHMDPAAWWQILTSYEETLYTPLLFLSYQIDYAFGGLNATVYHTHSLIIHVITALLMSVLLYQLTTKRLASVIAGLLFLVHPLNTELVAWASLRKDLLAGMFGLLMIILYLRSQENKDRKTYVLSVISLALALLAKPSAITIPLIIPLLDYFQKRSPKTQLVFYIPFFVLSGCIAMINTMNKNQTFQLYEFSVLENVLLSFKSTFMLLLWFIAPVKLSVIHPFTDPVSLFSVHIIIPLIFLLIIFGAAWKYRKNDPLFLNGLLIFVILLLPSFRRFRTGENFADIFFTGERYAYLPMIGLLLIVTVLLSRGFERFSKKTMMIPFFAVLILFSFMARVQAAVWEDTQSLFKNVTHHYDNAQAAHNNLGVLYMERGLTDLAVREYQKSIRILPTGRAYANLGQAYLKGGQFPEALDAFENALTFNPLNAPVQLNIGVIYVKMNDHDQAIAAFRHAAEMDPLSPLPWIDIGLVRELQSNIIGAREAYERALEIDPGNSAVLQKLEALG